jgi:hypothetical protein
MRAIIISRFIHKNFERGWENEKRVENADSRSLRST